MIRPLIIFIAISTVLAQHDFSGNKLSVLRWCTTSTEEKYKCQNFSRAVERDKGMFDDYYLDVQCHIEYSTDDCISSIDQSRADLMSLDAGEVFIAGRYFSLVPIMQEVIEDGLTNNYAVAVIKKDTLPDVYHIRDLRNKKACFPYVGSQAGWNIPIYTLITEGNMKIVDCNNHVKSAIEFFGPSCAVNSLINKYNPIGDNSDKLCQICTGKVPGGKCTPTDPYYGFEGAFKCLLEAGEVAFLKHTTVLEMINSKRYSGVSLNDFELLCKNGQRAPVQDYIQCNWGLVPTNALVTSSAQSIENRKQFENFMTSALKYYAKTKRTFQSYNTTTESSRFGSNSNNNFGNRNTPNSFYNNNNNNNNNYDDFNSRRNFNNNNNEFYDPNNFDDQKSYNDSQFYENFDLFVSDRYGTRLNLMFQDASNSLKGIEEINQNFKSYLGQHEKIIYDIRQCPVERMSLCVTSDAEYEKCVKMRTALKAQLIKPEMICYKAHSHINCMQSIQSGVADVAVFDASDVYTAGLRYDLIPFISEVYNLGLPEYYVVAVAKVEDPDTELTYLKNKYTCHSGINTAAGWVYPLAYLISNGWMRPYGCDSMRAAAEYFTKSCVPGAISTEYNTGVPYDNMCDLCHGASYRYCRRDASEDYYGHTGAFRCLVEGGGHVAFVKHTTVFESTGGKRKEWWARDALEDDFELLCADGTRAKTTEYQTCNLGKVKSNAIVTRGGDSYNEQEVNAYINLFIYAQQFYGRKDQDDFSFSMFYSHSPYHDLIFQDSTRQLQVIDRSKRRWDLYLGSDFLRARRITDCDSHAIKLHFSIALVLIVSALHFTFYY